MVFDVALIPQGAVALPTPDMSAQEVAALEQLNEAATEVTALAAKKRDERAAAGIVDTPPTPEPPAADANGGMELNFGTPLSILGSAESGRLRRLAFGRSLQDEGGDEFAIDITQFMSFELVRGTDSAPERKLAYTPKLDGFGGESLKIAFEFENPLYVSVGETPDLIVAQFTDPRLLVDPETGMFVQTPGIITELPRMLLSDNATEILGASCYLFAAATNTWIIVLIFIAFSLTAMTKSIWQFVNTIQILAYLRWFVTWPANGDMAFKCLDYSVSGKIQTDFLWNIFEHAIYGEDHFKKPLNEVDKYPVFVNEDDNLAKALGIYPALLVVIVLAMIYTLVLKKCKSRNLKMRKQYNSLNRKLYYNTLIRYLLEINLPLTHQCISVVWFVGLNSMTTSVLHGVFGLLMIVFPALILQFVLRNKSKLQERNYVSRYGTLYQGVKTDRKSTALYSFVFVMRRLLFVCIVVFFDEYAFAKPMAFLQANVLYLIWTGWTKPHTDPWYNFLEKLNEVGLIVIGYVFMLQTAFMEDQEVKYQMGWAAIWIAVVLYFFNFISMIYVFMRELKHSYRMYSVKRKFILQYSRKGMIE